MDGAIDTESPDIVLVKRRKPEMSSILRDMSPKTNTFGGSKSSAIGCEIQVPPKYSVDTEADLSGALGKLQLNTTPKKTLAPVETVDGYEIKADDPLARLPGGFGLPLDLFHRMYPHQHEGVSWMWSLHECNAFGVNSAKQIDQRVHGGILADDMGMGKTLQVAAFVSGLFHSEMTQTVLIICPASLIPVWEKEFAKWAPEVRVKVYHGSAPNSDKNFHSVRKRGGVILTTYGMCVSRPKQFGMVADAEDNISWDLMVLDEGHKIKNPSTQVYKTMVAAEAKYRLLLSGTPLQNHLDELWALFNFVGQGRLLGSARSFSMRISSFLIAGRDRDASAVELEAAQVKSDLLHSLIDPYMLRREKKLLTEQAGADSATSCAPKQTTMAALGSKSEVVVWTQMLPVQLEMYKTFLEGDEVARAWNKSCSPLAALIVLKKIATHPILIKERDAETEGSARAADTTEQGPSSERKLSRHGALPSTRELLSTSGKLACFVSLLGELLTQGSRVLVFSNSRMLLDVISATLTDEEYFGAPIPHLRIDGGVVKPSDRQVIVDNFNKNTSYQVCLLTTGVGALGLTLTGADRVIIFDPSWNPAVEQQAVDRAYRVGQTKDVVTYRLITCGTVEEKMYRTQVFKEGLSTSVVRSNKQTPGKCEPTRLLSKADLRDLFTLGDTDTSSTKIIIDKYEELKPRYKEDIMAHLHYLESSKSIRCFAGFTPHDVLFSVDPKVAAVIAKALCADKLDVFVDGSPAPYGKSSRPKPAIAQIASSARNTTPEFDHLIDLTIDEPIPLLDEPAISPYPPALPSNLICAMHEARLHAGGLDPAALRCVCAMSPGSKDLVDYATECCRAAELEGNPTALADTLETALDALAICDGDLELHKYAMRIGHALGFM